MGEGGPSFEAKEINLGDSAQGHWKEARGKTKRVSQRPEAGLEEGEGRGKKRDS